MSSVRPGTPTGGYLPRPVLGAHVGPLASALIVRHCAERLGQVAEQYELVGTPGSLDAARQLRRALAEMTESARLRNERQREIADSGDYGIPKMADESVSSCPPRTGVMVAQAVAAQLELDVRTVTGWCASGELAATRGPGRGRPWLVLVEDLADFLERRQGA